MPVGAVLGEIFAKAVLSETLKLGAELPLFARVKRRIQIYFKRRTLFGALPRALDAFSLEHPDLTSSFFDEHFLRARVAPEIAKFLTRNEDPDSAAIAVRYAEQFHSTVGDIATAVAEFLSLVEGELQKEPTFTEILDSRGIEAARKSASRVEALIESRYAVSHQIPDNIPVAAEVKRAFLAASLPLLNWPQTLPNDTWLERPELEALAARIKDSERPLTVLLGSPGSGKSALLSKFANSLRAEGQTLLAIKADQVPATVRSLDDLRRYLGISHDLLMCIRRASEVAMFTLVVDQLDALSEMTDLSSERLNVLLSLISHASVMPNVRVACSSRQIEYQYDSRLRVLDGNEINLALPSWEKVEPILTARGLKTAAWPGDFKEMLRTPQHLRIFLANFADPAEPSVFVTYLQMLDQLWETRVSERGKRPDKERVLVRLARDMADEEALWLPVAKYSANQREIDDLVAAGILSKAPGGSAIGFAHQTLHEHAIARTIAAGEVLLSDFTIARQTALHVRPKVWNTLHYLRATHPIAYERELAALWNAKNLRVHLRYLLIEFLGVIEDPRPQEVELLRPVFFQPEQAPKACAAIAGRRKWFELTVDSALTNVMRSAKIASAACLVLQKASVHSGPAVLAAMQKFWTSNESNRVLAFWVLRDFAAWDKAAVDFALSLLANTKVDNWTICYIATQAAVQVPDFAPKLIAATLSKNLDQARRTREESLKERSAAYAEEVPTAVSKLLSISAKDPLRNVIGESTGWYELPAVAEAAPVAFTRELWPWFEAFALEAKRGHAAAVANQYSDDAVSVLEFSLDDDVRETNPLAEALRIALTGTAEKDEQLFREIVDRSKPADSMLIHRFLSFGLEALSDKDPKFVLRYLVEDERRLVLGTYRDSLSRSRPVIAALAASALEQEEFAKLEKVILSFNHYGASEADDAKTKQSKAKWNRQRRLALLRAIPSTRLSEAARKMVDEESRIFPRAGDPEIRVRGGIVRSPMSKDQMAKAQDKDIVKLFSELPDSTEWGDNRRWFDDEGGIRAGGSIQASRALAEMAKENPTKALSVIDEFKPSTHTRPTAYVLEALDKDKIDNEEYFKILRKLVSKGFDSPDFLEGIARNLQSRIVAPIGLPDDICDLLLKSFQTYSRPPDTRSAEEQGSDVATSVLWGMHGARAVPGGEYSVLETLLLALLFKRPIPRAKVVAILELALVEKDVPLDWWKTLMHQVLRRLHWCQTGRATSFLNRLVDLQPSFLGSPEGVMTLAFSADWAPRADMLRWLSVLKGSRWPQADQAYGEIIGLQSLMHPKGRRIAAIVSQAIADASGTSPDARAQDVCRGLAYAVANLWPEENLRKRSTELFVRLAPVANAAIANALFDLFRVVGALPPDEHSARILESLLSQKLAWKATHHTFLVDRLLDILPNQPKIVSSLANEMVQIFGKDLANLSTARAADTPSMITIALTLQRQAEPYRTKGLELFEALLTLEAYQVRDALAEIDRRPLTGTAPVQRRVRRRRGRRS